MIAVLFADWDAWIKKGSLQTFGFMIGGLGVAAVLTFFRPEAMMEFFTFFLVWLGFKMGKQSWGGIEVWAWVGRGGFSPARGIMGKCLSVTVLLLVHAFAAMPGIIIMTMVWGVSLSSLGWALISWWAAIQVATFISTLVHLLRPDNRYLHGFLVSFWLIATAIFPHIGGANPFVQIWACVIPAGTPYGIYWLFNILLLLSLWFAIWYLLRKEVNYHASQSGAGLSIEE